MFEKHRALRLVIVFLAIVFSRMNNRLRFIDIINRLWIVCFVFTF